MKAVYDRLARDLGRVQAGAVVPETREILAKLGGLRGRVKLGGPCEVEVRPRLR